MGRASSTFSAMNRDLIPLMPVTAEAASAHAALTAELGWDDLNRCVYCDRRGTSMTNDHWTPVVREYLPTGAGDDLWNIVRACSSCNASKSNRDVLGWFDDKFGGALRAGCAETRARRDRLALYSAAHARYAGRWRVARELIEYVVGTRKRIYKMHRLLSDARSEEGV